MCRRRGRSSPDHPRSDPVEQFARSHGNADEQQREARVDDQFQGLMALWFVFVRLFWGCFGVRHRRLEPPRVQARHLQGYYIGSRVRTDQSRFSLFRAHKSVSYSYSLSVSYSYSVSGLRAIRVCA